MKVRLFQGVGNVTASKRHLILDIEWPDGLQLPSRGDRILAANEMIEVDHVEYMQGEDPQVMFELVDITNLRSSETPEEWAESYRRGWELR
jgi:hypothetical protein